MQPKETIQIDGALLPRSMGIIWTRNGDGGSHVVIDVFAMGHHNVERISRAA